MPETNADKYLNSAKEAWHCQLPVGAVPSGKVSNSVFLIQYYIAIRYICTSCEFGAGSEFKLDGGLGEREKSVNSDI
jgi:hypothetical protein